MFTFILVIHVIVCLFLIFIVLVQSGKGAELGAAFGGSSQTLFGARGAATLFSKLTTVAAVIFMLTSFTLAIMASRRASVVRATPMATEQRTMPHGPGPISGPVKGAPAVPAGPAAPAAPAAPSK